MLPAIEDLSSSSSAGPELDEGHTLVPKVRERKKKRKADEGTVPCDLETTLRGVLGKKCGCKKHCFEPFREDSKFVELLQFRQSWNELHKTDQDKMDAWLRWEALTTCRLVE